MNELTAPPGRPGLWDMLFGGGFINMSLWMAILGGVGIALLVALFGDRRRASTADLVYGLLRVQVNVFLLLVSIGSLATYSPFSGPSGILLMFIQTALFERPRAIAFFCVLIGVVTGLTAFRWRRLPRPSTVGALCMPLAIVDQVLILIACLSMYATYV